TVAQVAIDVGPSPHARERVPRHTGSRIFFRRWGKAASRVCLQAIPAQELSGDDLLAQTTREKLTAGRVATPRKARAPCNCGGVLYALRHRKIPLRFDAHFNEFHIIHPDGYMVIRFCPSCGARFPESRRDERLFLKISDTERGRIKRRFGRLRTY